MSRERFWCYVSYASDAGFLGGLYTQAAGPDDIRAHPANPGGEAMVFQLDDEEAARIPVDARDRLLTKEEVERVSEAMGHGKLTTVAQYESETGREVNAPMICEKHNTRPS